MPRAPIPRSLVLAALCAAGCLAFPAWGEPLTDDEIAELARKPSIGLYKGYAEFKMAHYAEARRIWEALAERGVGDAWFNLGILAEDGLGEPRDPAEARRRYERAAHAGSSNAALRLGLMLQTDALGAPDPAAAREWLRKAADLGDSEAATQLALLERSAGGPADGPDRRLAEARRLESEGRLPEAVAAYRAIADAGDPRGLTRLAWLHEAGRGVTRDLAQAASLFRRAAEAGEPEAQYALSVMLETGAGQPRDAEAAMRWLRASAKAGYRPAVEALGER